MAGVYLSEKGFTTNPQKNIKSRFTSLPCQVSESPELTMIVHQFLEANRAPWQVEKDF
jgi:putative transposase